MAQRQDTRLEPLATGRIRAERPVELPFMAPRLQGTLFPDGRLAVALWGAGDIATLRFAAPPGPVTYGPNGADGPGWSLHVAQSAPAVLVRGLAAPRIGAARRGAWWHRPDGAAPAVERGADTTVVTLGWGVLIVTRRGADTLVAAGADRAEAERGAALTVEQITAEAAAYAAACDRLAEAQPVLRSMVQQGVHAALSSVRRDAGGGFGGIAAGQAYSAPARTYFRDAYWTVQALLPLAPEAVAAEIDLLAGGLREDGEAPSGVILSGPAQSAAWEALRARDAAIARDHRRPGEWWSDHFDSPIFFALMIADYVAATGDDGPVHRHWPKIRAVYQRYRALSVAGGGLPAKPRHDRDWADNVYRSGLVAYDLGLWIGLLGAVGRWAERRDPDLARDAAALAGTARALLVERLWREPEGWCAEYLAADGFREDHLAIDTLTLVRYGALDEARSRRLLVAMRQHLCTDANAGQPFGDWGTMAVFPPYRRRGDLRAKSAFPFRYHNGGDWPYWDGVLAAELLRRAMAGWDYPLLRWWRSCLERGWLGAIEYFSPPYGRGSLLQGWSSLPAAVALRHRDAVLARR